MLGRAGPSPTRTRLAQQALVLELARNVAVLHVFWKMFEAEGVVGHATIVGGCVSRAATGLTEPFHMAIPLNPGRLAVLN